MKIFALLTALGFTTLALAENEPVTDPDSELGAGLQLAQANLSERQQFAHANIFNRRQGGCNARPRACVNNYCALAVKGTGDDDNLPPLTSRQEDCSSFMHKTVSYDVTATVTEAVVKRRQQTIAPSDIPSYASEACSDADKYSSACSCWGITASTTTVSAVVATVTVQPPVERLSGRIMAKRKDNGAELGYLTVGSTKYMHTYASSASNAILFQVVGTRSGDVMSQVNIEELNNDRTTYFGLVVGRDSSNDNIGAGSFHYLYPGPVWESTIPGSPAQIVSNQYTTGSGSTKGAQTSVWTIDFSTGDVTAHWVNTDETTPSVLFFSQSNYVYAGGDPSAFQTRYPSPIVPLTLHWVPEVQES